MTRLWRRAYGLLGHRGLFLLLLGVVEIIYGAGLLTAAGRDTRTEHWWPASVGDLGGLPLDLWGTVWVLIGSLCLLTAWTAADRIGYAAGVLLNVGWSAFAVQRWLATGEAGSWAPAAIYTGIAVGVFLVAGWPEPPKTPPAALPPPPTPEELAAVARIARPDQPPGPPP